MELSFGAFIIRKSSGKSQNVKRLTASMKKQEKTDSQRERGYALNTRFFFLNKK